LSDAPAVDRAALDAAAAGGADVYEASSAVLDAASPVRTSSGLVALADWLPQPLSAALQPAPALAVGLIDVQDPGNVGAIIRSAAALGATGVAALGATAHPGGWKALRGAMGSTFRLPVAVDQIDAAIEAGRRLGLRVIAAAPDESQPIDRVDLRRPTL